MKIMRDLLYGTRGSAHELYNMFIYMWTSLLMDASL